MPTESHNTTIGELAKEMMKSKESTKQGSTSKQPTVKEEIQARLADSGEM